MKIAILSDLHTEGAFFSMELTNRTKPDLIILAGDIFNSRMQPFAGLKKRDPSIPILAIPGNHEYYGSQTRTEDEKFDYLSIPGITLLNCKSTVINGVKFICCTLWPTLRGASNECKKSIFCSVCDFKYIHDMDLSRISTLGMEHTEWLARELAVAHDGPIVVVTHFLPTYKSVAPEFMADPGTVMLNNYFVSLVEELIKPPVSLWVHGHTHTNCDYTLNGVRVVCNPRGYIRLRGPENLDFDPEFTVTI